VKKINLNPKRKGEIQNGTFSFNMPAEQGDKVEDTFTRRREAYLDPTYFGVLITMKNRQEKEEVGALPDTSSRERERQGHLTQAAKFSWF